MPLKLGIVTISYNQGRYLTEAIDSVRLSAPERLQYVMVDPGSQDGSREIIQQRRNRFHAVILEPDKGPPDGLNRGFLACDAEILGYLNSDDRFAPGALDYALNYFERHPEVDVLCGAIRIIDQRGRPSRRRRLPDRVDPRKYACEACFFWQQATFFRRSAYLLAGGFNVARRVIWDGDLVVNMALKGMRFGYVNTLLGDFRIYRDSITGSGRLRYALARDRQAVRELILNSGVPPISPFEELARRLLYKFDIRRHLGYFFGAETLTGPGAPGVVARLTPADAWAQEAQR